MRPRGTRPAVVTALAVAALTALGCQGNVGETPHDGGALADGALADGAVVDGVSVGGACTIAPLLSLFQTRCTNSGCHGGVQYPELTLDSLPGWINQHSHEAPSQMLVVPGNPMASWIYLKVSGMQGPAGGPLMPLGTATPDPSVVAVVQAWIEAGAPTQCDGDAGLEAPSRPDPNDLPQAALFTCSAGATAASSPARLRRIDQTEWTYAADKPLTGTFWGSTAYSNPFLAPPTVPYSTYAADLTLDPTTLDLYTLVLPEAPSDWETRDPQGRVAPFIPGYRTFPVYDDDAHIGCIFTTAVPDDACRDHYIDQFLSLSVLSRAPTTAEHAHLRARLDASIAAEGGDVSKRRATLDDLGQAAWLTSGALFRSEMGAAVAGDASGRTRLTNEELALALGSVLSMRRPGAALTLGAVRPGDPDWATPQNGWLQQVRAAASDGTIQDPVVMRRLIETYRGGVDPARNDLAFDIDARRLISPSTGLPERGEYWLAPRIAGFFREWLGYGPATTVFKDLPGATSQFMPGYTGDTQYEPSSVGYVNLQTGYFGWESSLVQQMDDTIARTVLDSATSHTNVFQALMTTRLWHLPSNAADISTQTCATNADCTTSGLTTCTSLHVCGSSISGTTSTMDRPYNITGQVAATPAARWVTLPAAERSGVLTHPAWLAAHGDNFENDPSLVHRGHWIRENLLCHSVPGLGNVMVDARLPPGADASARDRVHAGIDMNANATTCLGCHGLMNTLGLPFEMYNHAGFVRATDHGHAPDGSSTVTNADDPALNRPYTDAVALAQALATSQYAQRCFVRQAFRYFTGRDETLADACTLSAMEQALGRGSFFDMLESLVTSDTFLYRTNPGGMP